MGWVIDGGPYGLARGETEIEAYENYLRRRNRIIREDWRWSEEKIQEEVRKYVQKMDKPEQAE